MSKKSFYKEQAEKFRDFADKNPGRELLSLFAEWADSKDFSNKDKKAIFAETQRQKARYGEGSSKRGWEVLKARLYEHGLTGIEVEEAQSSFHKGIEILAKMFLSQMPIEKKR